MKKWILLLLLLPSIAWGDMITGGSIKGGTIGSRCTLDQNQMTDDNGIAMGMLSSKKVAQTFKSSITADLCSITVSVRRVGIPTDSLRLQIYSDGVTYPDTLLATAVNDVLGSTLTDDASGRSYFVFSTGLSLVAETTYWMVFSRTGSLSDILFYYVDGANRAEEESEEDAYTRGRSYFQDGSDVWTGVDEMEEGFRTWQDRFFMEYHY